MNLNKIIHKPIITEKSVADREQSNRYHFMVNPKATKDAIKLEIQRLFGVDVLDIKTMVVPGKKRRIISKNKNRVTRFKSTKKWKKAVVQIKEKQEIKLVTEGK